MSKIGAVLINRHSFVVHMNFDSTKRFDPSFRALKYCNIDCNALELFDFE